MKKLDSLHAAKTIPSVIPSNNDDELTRTVITAPMSISSPHPVGPNAKTSNIYLDKKKRLL
jgi:hypothetical protein